jgi:hypothetical protein
MLVCNSFSTTAHEIAGAARIRHSLRPLFREGERFQANLGQSEPREYEAVSCADADVISSDAELISG